MVDLYPGRALDAGQIGAITHLVASSIPNLEPEKVTVVDQKGKLLSSPKMSDGMQATSTRFDYQKRLESHYVKRIESILAPIVGADSVKAQVVADLDFTSSEQTQESYDPERTAVRSEQLVEEQSSRNGGASGIPGALSNQPPEAGTVTPEGTAALDQENKGSSPIRSSSRSIRNFELERTISHTRYASGAIKRLSVAVVIDDGQKIGEEGEIIRLPRSPEEIENITTLVKETMGFDENHIHSLLQSVPKYSASQIFRLVKSKIGRAHV